MPSARVTVFVSGQLLQLPQSAWKTRSSGRWVGGAVQPFLSTYGLFERNWVNFPVLWPVSEPLAMLFVVFLSFFL